MCDGHEGGLRTLPFFTGSPALPLLRMPLHSTCHVACFVYYFRVCQGACRSVYMLTQRSVTKPHAYISNWKYVLNQDSDGTTCICELMLLRAFSAHALLIIHSYKCQRTQTIHAVYHWHCRSMTLDHKVNINIRSSMIDSQAMIEKRTHTHTNRSMQTHAWACKRNTNARTRICTLIHAVCRHTANANALSVLCVGMS